VEEAGERGENDAHAGRKSKERQEERDEMESRIVSEETKAVAQILIASVFVTLSRCINLYLNL